MIIDCGSCAVAGLACDDCVVTVLLGAPDGAVCQVADEHADALDVLAASGLVPPLRLVPRAVPSEIDPPRAARTKVG